MVDDRDLALPDVAASFVSKSAVAQARERLGPAPLDWLFNASAELSSAQDKEACRFGLVAMCVLPQARQKSSELPEFWRAHAIAVMQEICGALTAYNFIRLEIANAALEAWCAPTDSSFICAFPTIKYELLWTAVTRTCGKVPALLRRLR